MIVLAVVDDALSPDLPLGVELGVFIRREDAERLIRKPLYAKFSKSTSSSRELRLSHV